GGGVLLVGRLLTLRVRLLLGRVRLLTRRALLRLVLTLGLVPALGTVRLTGALRSLLLPLGVALRGGGVFGPAAFRLVALRGVGFRSLVRVCLLLLLLLPQG